MPRPAHWTRLLADSARFRPGTHVTDCLSCPRKKALLADGAKVDLDRLEARLAGTAVHRLLDTVEPETAEVPVQGELFGVWVVGSMDRLEGTTVVDYKTSNGKKAPSGPYPEHVWQLECYRYLASKNGLTTTGWILWYKWGLEWFCFPHDGPVWSEEELGRFKPHGSGWTTAELAKETARVEKGDPIESFSKVGESMVIGAKTACGYCEVEGPCKQTGALTEF